MGIPEWLEGMLKEGRYRSIYHMAQDFRAPQPMVHRWLKGKAIPSVSSCIKMAEAVGISPEEVVHMAAMTALARERDAHVAG